MVALDLAVVFAAFLALLCLQGVQVLLQVLNFLLGSIPLIGGALAKTISFDARGIAWLWDHTGPIAQWFGQGTVNHSTEQWMNVQAHSATHDALGKTNNVTIPQAQTAAVSQAVGIIQPFEQGVNGFISGVQGFITWQHGQNAALFNRTDVVLPQVIAQTRGDLLQRITASAQTVTSSLEGEVKRVEAEIGPAAAGAEAGAVRQLAPQIGAVQTQVGDLAHTVTGVLAPAVAGVLTLTQTLVGRITQVEECTAGICSTGTGNALGDLGKILQGLAPLIEGGVLFALLAEAARDPVGVAHDLDAVVGGLVGDAAGVFRGAVGLAA